MVTNNSANETQTGLQSMDANGVHNGRSITAGTNIAVTNGDGIAGNPSVAVTAPFAATTLTQNSLILGNGAGNVSALGAATNGQIPIGSTGNPPVLNTITAGAGITVTNGAGSITIASSSGGGGLTSITGDTGGALTGPNVNVSGSTTTYNTGNPGTNTLGVEVVSASNTILVGRGPTTPSTTVGPLTNGQLLIGRSGDTPLPATLTAGTNISITNASGSITINNTAATPGNNSTLSFFDDMLYGITSIATGVLGYFGAGGTLGGTVITDSTWSGLTTNRPGIVILSTGTGAGASSTLGTNYSIVLGGGTITLDFCFQLGALGSASNRYEFYCGMTEFNTPFGAGGTSGDFLCFKYVDNLNLGRWTAQCSRAGVVTSNSTGVAANTNWTVLRIVINAAASQVQFYIGTTVANVTLFSTISTNIPTDPLAITMYQYNPAATAVGQRTYVDFISVSQPLTTAR